MTPLSFLSRHRWSARPPAWSRLGVWSGACLFGFGGLPAARALDFFFTAAPGFEALRSIDGHTTADIFAALDAAGANWSAPFSDDVRVKVKFEFAPLSGGLLASTDSTYFTYTYSQARTALFLDRTTDYDLSALAHTPAGGSFPMMINLTSDNPWGAGSETAYIDLAGTNNSRVQMTSANARALGLFTADTFDATITIDTSVWWDFNTGNGVDGGSFDFVGTVAHELGHVMGFFSGVDAVDHNDPATLPADSFRVSTLDLFRYSAASASLGMIDFTASETSKYFSLDGGLTSWREFATGEEHGDGFYPGHWQKRPGDGVFGTDPGDFGRDGIMGAWIEYGERLDFAAVDYVSMDAIGWDLNPFFHFPVTNPVPVGGVSVPDGASSWPLLALGLAFVGALSQRCNKTQPPTSAVPARRR